MAPRAPDTDAGGPAAAHAERPPSRAGAPAPRAAAQRPPMMIGKAPGEAGARPKSLTIGAVCKALVQELEDFGVVKGELRGGVRYFDETEREIVAAVAELARYGVGGRNLRVFRSSADREANLLQQILAPALRSRNPERRKEAIEAL